MFRNYLKVALRNLKRNKVFSFINITGLAVGLAAAMVIFLWIRFEKSYDTFHANYDNLYRVLENQKYGTGEVYTFSSTPAPLSKALKANYPEIKYASRLSWTMSHVFHYGDKHIQETGTCVDPDFLEMFSFNWLKGNKTTSLTEPNSIVLSNVLAEKYFGKDDPIGKVIRVEDDRMYKVTGVYEALPKNSTLRFDWLMPAADYVKLYMNNEEVWDNNNIQTYVQLQESAHPDVVTSKITDYVAKQHTDQVNVKLLLHPAKDWYLRHEFRDGINTGGKIGYINLFTVVAIFILLIACINFMNLSTAQASKRSREVGVRKVVGGDKAALVRQFLGESLLLTLIAGLFAIGIVELVLPSLNTLLQKELNLSFRNGADIAVFVSLLFLTGLIAGSYPALVLSSFQPIAVLKGAVHGVKGKHSWLRRSLVVLQFVISVVMIVGTIIVYQQIKYFQNKNLGYNKENLVYFSSAGIPADKYDLFKNQLTAISGVKSVTRSSINFTGSNNSTSNVMWEGKRSEKEVLFSIINTDNDLLKTFGIGLREGRDFSKDYGMDSLSFIINEEAVKRMGLQYPVIGKQLEFWERKGTIIGVAKDFHISSIHGQIEPVIIQAQNWTWTYFVRIDGSRTPEIIKKIEGVYKQNLPDRPFSYKFMDQEYAEMYDSEMQIGELAKWFTVLAIFISCLGLFGLVSLAAAQRTKEIGIRKVLGASITSIFSLLSKEFLRLVFIASLIAFPLAWKLMDNWLGNFVYHIDMQWWVFALAGLTAVLIALATVSFQAIKAASSNPVKSLRTE